MYNAIWFIGTTSFNPHNRVSEYSKVAGYKINVQKLILFQYISNKNIK